MANNNFADGTSVGSSLTRTNPNASPSNVLKVRGIKRTGGCAYAATYTWAITTAGDLFTATPTGGNTDANLRVMRWRITDGQGGEALGALNLAARTTAVAINTAALDAKNKWTVEFYAEVVDAAGKKCSDGWLLEIPAGLAISNPSGSGQDV